MADKEEDKEGTSQSRIERIADRVTTNASRLIFLIVAVLVIVAAAAGIFSYLRSAKEAREKKAEDAIFQAELEMMNKPEKDGIQVFGKLATDFAGLPAAARARILEFSHAFNTRDFAAAESAAREFLKSNPDSIFASRARLALGETLTQQGKISEAVSTLREVTSARHPDTYPEAKLALAQALERDAEQAKDNPDEYKKKLDAAAEEYNDIVSQARSTSQRDFWPQAVVLPADFALVVLRDKINGYKHPAPTGAGESGAAAVPTNSADMPPPPADPVEAVKAHAEDAAKKAVDEAVKALESVDEAKK